MLRGLLYFLKLTLFWLIFFSIYRLLFLLIYPGLIPEGKTGEAWCSFLFGLRLDLSTIAYLITLPLIFWALQQFIKHNAWNFLNHYYHMIAIASVALLCISNIAMYEEWHALINFNTLHYLIAPGKMFPYLTTLKLVGVCVGMAAIVAVFVLLFRAMILMVMPYSTGSLTKKIGVVASLYPFVFLVMRGGFQDRPINERAAMYSDANIINHISINPLWHLGRMTQLGLMEDETPNTSAK